LGADSLEIAFELGRLVCSLAIVPAPSKMQGATDIPRCASSFIAARLLRRWLVRAAGEGRLTREGAADTAATPS